MHLTSSLPLFEGRLSPNWLHTGFRLAKSRGRVSLVRQPSYAKDEGHKSNLPPHNNNIHRSHRPQLAASDPTNLFILHWIHQCFHCGLVHSFLSIRFSPFR